MVRYAAVAGDVLSRQLRALPPTHAILASAEAQRLSLEISHGAVRALVRRVMADIRARLRAHELPAEREFLIRHALGELARAAHRARLPTLRSVLNATGVLLHTNLGRAPLGEEVLAHVSLVGQGYATLEYDLARGRRGHRDAIVRPLLQEILGAEDALVVNNCAAAVLLACTALATGRDVVVSRGELVEIGGGFRVPEVITSCGARLVEVGTTNRTRIEDYARAVGPDTAMILRVHRSNFAITGFTADATREELVALGHKANVPVVEDLGSGVLVHPLAPGLPREPTVRESIAAGVGLVMCSGDKLMGGPQAGIVAGRGDLVEKLRQHPLARALRPGRLVMSALEATLRVVAEGRASVALPVVRALSERPETVRARAEAVLAVLVDLGVDVHGVVAKVQETTARVGGGTMPTVRLPSYAVRVSGIDAVKLEKALRAGNPAVVARMEDHAVLLDLRAVAERDVRALGEALVTAVQKVQGGGADGGSDDTDNAENGG